MKKCSELCHRGQVSLQLVRTYCASKCQDKLHSRTGKLYVTFTSKRKRLPPTAKNLLLFPSWFKSNCSYSNQNRREWVLQWHNVQFIGSLLTCMDEMLWFSTTLKHYHLRVIQRLQSCVCKWLPPASWRRCLPCWWKMSHCPMLLGHTNLIFLASLIIYSLQKDAFAIYAGPNTVCRTTEASSRPGVP